jgi:hypothetical protein
MWYISMANQQKKISGLTLFFMEIDQHWNYCKLRANLPAISYSLRDRNQLTDFHIIDLLFDIVRQFQLIGYCNNNWGNLFIP